MQIHSPEVVSLIHITSTFTRIENLYEDELRGRQKRFSVNVWADILNNRIIGQYILPNRLNSKMYLIFVRDILPVLLEDVTFEARFGMWMHHNSAPAYLDHIWRKLMETVELDVLGLQPGFPDYQILHHLIFLYCGDIWKRSFMNPLLRVDLIWTLKYKYQPLLSKNPSLYRLRRSLINRFEVCTKVEGGHVDYLL